MDLASRSSMNDAFVDQTKAFLCHDPGDIDIISINHSGFIFNNVSLKAPATQMMLKL